MPDFLKTYGDTEGPLGFPLPDRQAQALDALLKTLPRTPDHEYRHREFPPVLPGQDAGGPAARAVTELNPGERSDVSWISTESPDRVREVVVARGMDDSHFRGNPLVTLQHAYHLPPVGRSLWRKRVKDGPVAGIKAKTLYPARPESWPAASPWPPDQVLTLVQAGLL